MSWQPAYPGPRKHARLTHFYYLPRSKRFITFLSAGVVSGAFGSIVSGAISSSIDGNLGIRGWRWLFIVEGKQASEANHPYHIRALG